MTTKKTVEKTTHSTPEYGVWYNFSEVLNFFREIKKTNDDFETYCPCFTCETFRQGFWGDRKHINVGYPEDLEYIYNNVWEVNADYRPPCVITYVNRFGEERPYIPTSREMTTARWRLVEKKDIRWEDEWGEKFDTKPVSEW